MIISRVSPYLAACNSLGGYQPDDFNATLPCRAGAAFIRVTFAIFLLYSARFRRVEVTFIRVNICEIPTV